MYISTLLAYCWRRLGLPKNTFRYINMPLLVYLRSPLHKTAQMFICDKETGLVQTIRHVCTYIDPAWCQYTPCFIACNPLMDPTGLQLYRAYHFDFSITCVFKKCRPLIPSLMVFFFLQINIYCLFCITEDFKRASQPIFTPQV
jgi:hypothetical protein